MTLLHPANGLPVALALRIGTIAAALLAGRRHTAACRIAFVGSVIASLVTGLTAAAVLCGGSSVQGGSLHAYLAYVIALVVSLVLLVWWTR